MSYVLVAHLTVNVSDRLTISIQAFGPFEDEPTANKLGEAFKTEAEPYKVSIRTKVIESEVASEECDRVDEPPADPKEHLRDWVREELMPVR